MSGPIGTNGNTPAWMKPGWLPTLSVVEWPRLDRLRSEQERLIRDYKATVWQAPRLRERFAAEDEQALEAEREAVRTGTEAPANVTSPLRRRAELDVAEARAAEALVALCDHTKRVGAEVYAHWAEAEAAVADARVSAGLGGPVIEQTIENAVEGVAAERMNQKRQADDLRFAKQRRELHADTRALRTLLNTTLAGGGENIAAQTEAVLSGSWR